ncbi:MAG: hypothetical protein DRN24_06915 [Thermoplasmata archaeon]|nr:MAG: hypothetical protein DRN24_06915 [Thermoplasmata archaeon]
MINMIEIDWFTIVTLLILVLSFLIALKLYTMFPEDSNPWFLVLLLVFIVISAIMIIYILYLFFVDIGWLSSYPTSNITCTGMVIQI